MSTQPFADKAWTVREVANDRGDRAIVKVRRRVIDPRGAAPTDINVILSHIGIPDSFDLLINAENGKQHRYVVWRRNDASAWRSNNSIYRPLPSSPDIFWACRCTIRNSPRPSIYLPRASGFAGGPGTFDWLATVRTLRRAS